MAIAKRPKSAADLEQDERERQEQAFLNAAPDAVKHDKPADTRMQTVHLRFEPDMLPRIDAAMREIGLTSRSAFVRYAVVQTLKNYNK